MQFYIRRIGQLCILFFVLLCEHLCKLMNNGSIILSHYGTTKLRTCIESDNRTVLFYRYCCIRVYSSLNVYRVMKYIRAYDRIYELYCHFSLSCCHENLIKIWPFIEYFITQYTLLPSFVLLGQYRCVILLIKSNYISKQRQIPKNDKRIKQKAFDDIRLSL